MRLVQITDTHVYDGADGRFDGIDTRASCACVFDALRASGASYDALALTGDLAMDGSAGAYAWLADVLMGEPAERFVLPGNHDDPVLLRQAGFASTCAPAVVERGAWRVFLLDTHVPGRADGRIGGRQLEWLADALAVPHGGWDALLLHHHPMAVGSPWMDAMGLEDAERFWTIVDARPSVRVAACGHVHQNLDCWRGHVRVLAAPSTCVQFMPRARRYAVDPRPPGYRTITLREDGRIETSVTRVPWPA